MRTKDTRDYSPNPEWIKRRKACEDCESTVYTLEIPIDELGWEQPNET